ncbi:protein G1-like7 [Zingiber officinale]|uniref:ALOG domain-containing protein n=1 Tax=Zingiber officinale TaxID=94328 RepID=A0A8J5GUU1_ZINOF|nr:protein G1-like7 [Zingiber officinale]XP_042397135.1 protein G1-like7 [Zingiber officinale]KAG6503241.1 hypothetical protein ZIOFF_035552 [Zingiber officinale]KAG6506638.1 hypothetical protein ZIOFF_031965 [Zingiber officinale]
MELGGDGDGEGPSSSSVSASADQTPLPSEPQPPLQQQQPLSRYESQKRRDWNTFLQYLKNHMPPLVLPRCSGAHVIEFLKYLDQFGKTKVHSSGCAFFGQVNPPSSCACPLRQAWGSLDALIGRLRAAYEENGGNQESNPFAASAVRIYLREVRENQSKARGIPYEKKKRKRGDVPAQLPRPARSAAAHQSSSSAAPSPFASSSSVPEKSADQLADGSSSVP